MMADLTAYRSAFGRLPEGVTGAEINAETHNVTLVNVHGGGVTGVDRSDRTVLYLRVSGDRTGYVYSEDLREDPGVLMLKAYENSKYSERDSADAMHRGDMATATDLGTLRAEGDVALLAEAAVGIEAAIHKSNPDVTDVFVSIRAETVGLHTLNSYGLDVQNTKPLYIMNAMFNSADETGRCSGAYNRTSSTLGGFDPEEFAANAGEILAAQRAPVSFETGVYPAILRQDAVYNILSTAWQLFSAHRYLEGSCRTAGMLGTAIASDRLTLIDYPAHEASGFNIGCDCEGTLGATVTLVDEGRFTGLMHNLSTARRMKVDPTGNAGRRPLLYGNIATDIVVTPRNICIRPGSVCFDDMVRHMDDGVIVTTTFDVFHSINIASGDFSIPCRGTVVKGGKPFRNVKSLSISGNILELFQDVEEVGDDFYFGTMLALDNYGIGSCSLRVKKLHVSGA